MKLSSKILSLTACAGIVGFACIGQARTIGYQVPGDDGVAASPKVRESLDQHQTVPTTADATEVSQEYCAPGYCAPGYDGIAASPKVRESMDQHRTVPTMTDTAAVPVGYCAVGDDGIAASPKVRESMDQHQVITYEIAPVR